MAELTVSDLAVEYRSGGYLVSPFKNLNVEAHDGELVALLGPSGSGKTTLLSCLAGLLTPTRGSIRLDGTEVTALEGPALSDYRRRRVGIAFQAFNLIPSLSALENVLMALYAAGTRGSAATERATALLADVGLSDRTRHRPAGLSGGQQQRVALARALANEPTLLLADEPTAHLDYIQVEGVLGLIRALACPGRLVLVATHDERLLPLADRVVELAPRPTADVPPEQVVLAAGDVLFEQGSRGARVYAVGSGEIEIFRARADGTEERLDLVGPGRYFGELGPMLGLPRTATARATVETVVTGYSLRDFRARAGRGPEIDLRKPRRPRRDGARARTGRVPAPR